MPHTRVDRHSISTCEQRKRGELVLQLGRGIKKILPPLFFACQHTTFNEPPKPSALVIDPKSMFARGWSTREVSCGISCAFLPCPRFSVCGSGSRAARPKWQAYKSDFERGFALRICCTKNVHTQAVCPATPLVRSLLNIPHRPRRTHDTHVHQSTGVEETAGERKDGHA